MYDLIFGFLLAYCIITYVIASYTVYLVHEEGNFKGMHRQQIYTAIAIFCMAPLTVPAIGWELRNKNEN